MTHIMLLILNVIFPIFSIILLGFLVEKRRLLGINSRHLINHFSFYIAMPILIFGSLANEPFENINHFRYIAGFTLSLILTYFLTLILFSVWRRADRLAIRSLKSLGASFPNAGYIGIPFIFAISGQGGIIPAALAAMLAYILIALTISLIELDLNRSRGCITVIKNIVNGWLKNPLISAAVAGIIYSYLALPFPKVANDIVRLLGGAAAPCALFAIGQTIAANRLSKLNEISVIASIKLVFQPLLTFAILRTLALPPSLIVTGTLLSALPTGAAKFMIAKRYGYYEQESSSLILFTTILSILSLSVLFLILGYWWPTGFTCLK